MPILAAAIAFAACGDGGRVSGDAPPTRGARLVVGSSLERWGLLVVPRDGGAPVLRSLDSPADSLWAGATHLPPSAAAHFLDRASIVLRTPEGQVLRYDADRDRLVELGTVGPEARFSVTDGTGIFADTAADRILEVSRDGAWTHASFGPLLWAAPLGGARGVAALVGPGSGEDAGAEGPSSDAGGGGGAVLTILGRGEKAPAPRASVAGAPPGLVTAWGRQLVLTAAGAGDALLLLPTVGDPGDPERIPLDGRVRSLAASPSTHQIYVGIAGPAGLVSVDRLGRAVASLAELPAPPTELRPAWFGGHLLARTGEAEAWFLPLGDGSPRRLETEWRADLPLGLPDDRVLLARGEEAALWSEEHPDRAEPMAGPVDAWWLPLRWRPAAPTSLAAADRPESGDAAGGAEAGDPAAAETAPEAETAARADTGAVPSAGTGEAAAAAETGPGAAEAEPGEEAGGEATLPGADSRPGAEIPSGFYAIVASSQAPEGIRRLTGRLAGAGYPSKVQRHRDEANELWYRALVGPYEDREAAETAARQLRRERGLQVWISEIGPGTRAADFE